MAFRCKALDRQGVACAHHSSAAPVLQAPKPLHRQCSSSCNASVIRASSTQRNGDVTTSRLPGCQLPGWTIAPGPSPNRRGIVCAVSVDPLSISDGIYRPGKTFTIHSQEELQNFTQKPQLTVLMAKSSHCRPCKKFALTYHSLAEQFKDCHLIEIMGDENKNTRKMMVDMKVKVTPTFFIYRNGQLLHSLTGTTRNVLRNAILERLGPNEAGRDWVDPPMDVDSDSEEDD